MNLRTSIQLLLSFQQYPRYFRWLQRRLIWRRVKNAGISAAPDVAFYGMPIFSLADNSRIEIGANCLICSDARATELGANHPVILRTLRPAAQIIIGRDTGISGGAICAAVRIEIGNECLIGANVVITDTDFHPLNPVGRRYNKSPDDIAAKPVSIEDNVFIGTGAMILKGVTVGRNSVIGAGSIVTKDVPPNSVVAGNPARILREF